MFSLNLEAITDPIGFAVKKELKHVPWFTPRFNTVGEAREWAKAMKVLMPAQSALLKVLGRGIPSPARLSNEVVLPKVREGKVSGVIVQEIIESWAK